MRPIFRGCGAPTAVIEQLEARRLFSATTGPSTNPSLVTESKEVVQKFDSPDKLPTGGDNLGTTTARVTDIDYGVVKRDGKFIVEITNIEWHMKIDVVSKKYLDEHNPVDWHKYHQMDHWTNDQFYHHALIIDEQSLMAHEEEHGRQFEKVAEQALTAYAKDWDKTHAEAAFRFDKKSEAEKYIKDTLEHVEPAEYTNANTGILLAELDAYPERGGMDGSDYDAVNAERASLKRQFEEWEKQGGK